ncbi:MAG: hypothetical protein CMC00_03880, partial [Flavobacteriaceae bacterium]|nr:hypothetical protein [Flavobacteriaceae bacterium]
FSSSKIWTYVYGNAQAPIVSEGTTWSLDGIDLIAGNFLTETLSAGTLVFTLEDDVTDFDIEVSGTITGAIDPTATYVNETLQSFTIDVV